MVQFNFQLDNVDELLAKLQKLRGAAMRKVFRQAVREAARPVLATARQIVPIDTGKLQGSLRIFAGRRSFRSINVVIKPGSRQALGIPPEAKGYYPAHIELGTKKFAANRYLRDAMELERSDAIRIINAHIKIGIEKAVT